MDYISPSIKLQIHTRGMKKYRNYRTDTVPPNPPNKSKPICGVKMEVGNIKIKKELKVSTSKKESITMMHKYLRKNFSPSNCMKYQTILTQHQSSRKGIP